VGSLRSGVLVAFSLFLPGAAAAQLVPGQHSIMPSVGATFATDNLLSTTTPIAFGIQPLPPEENASANLVSTEMRLDPGFSVGLRYAYNLTRRLAAEVEGNYGVSVFAIQLLEHLEEPTQEPQYETTTMDARIFRYGVNLAYHMGVWKDCHPFLLSGVGGQIINLRQKGPLNTDPVSNGTVVFGGGMNFRANNTLQIRAEVRDYVYNFHFDNQFAGPDSWQIMSYRDVGRAVAVSQPTRQHDLVVSLGFQMRIH
jgi:outer membrane protein with beta-barrel domain